MRVRRDDILIGKVVGENDEGITLFVPKNMNGVFNLTEGDQFLSLMFVRNTGPGTDTAWIPWEGSNGND